MLFFFSSSVPQKLSRTPNNLASRLRDSLPDLRLRLSPMQSYVINQPNDCFWPSFRNCFAVAISCSAAGKNEQMSPFGISRLKSKLAQRPAIARSNLTQSVGLLAPRQLRKLHASTCAKQSVGKVIGGKSLGGKQF